LLLLQGANLAIELKFQKLYFATLPKEIKERTTREFIKSNNCLDRGK
jgi:hypothetical protein